MKIEITQIPGCENQFNLKAHTHSHAGKAWIAIVKKGGKFGLDRNFGSKFDVTSTHNKYRDLEIFHKAEEGDFVEFASQESSSRQERKYYKVVSGKLQEVAASEIQ